MCSFTEEELLDRLKEVTNSADQAALLSDLGNLHLAEGRVQEGEAYFKKAVAVHAAEDNGAAEASELTGDNDAEDDWETEWEQNLGQITPPSERDPLTNGAAGQLPAKAREKTEVQQLRGAVSRRRAESPGSSGREDLEVPFDGRHILELYGLTSADTISHLESLLVSISSGPIDPVVRWVDDRTALAVFSNPTAAQAAFPNLEGGGYSVRPFSEACDASKGLPAVELQPPRPRPKTSAAVARRLIGAALNVPALRDKGAERELREQRQSQQELKRERQRQVDASWDS